MTTDEFWKIIDEVHRESEGDMDRKCEILGERLEELDDRQLTDFIRHFDAADVAAYTWSLWGAAYLIHGGCSDDGFQDFRATLLSLGRDVHERALADPDSLADLSPEDAEKLYYEGFQYVAHQIGRSRFGNLPEPAVERPREPSGTEWSEEDLHRLYPRLAAKYPSAPNPYGDGPPKKRWWMIW